MKAFVFGKDAGFVQSLRQPVKTTYVQRGVSGATIRFQMVALKDTEICKKKLESYSETQGMVARLENQRGEDMRTAEYVIQQRDNTIDRINKKLEGLEKQFVNERVENSKRFAEERAENNKRFEALDAKVQDLQQQINETKWNHHWGQVWTKIAPIIPPKTNGTARNKKLHALSLSEEELKKGEMLYDTRCKQCHPLPILRF